MIRDYIITVIIMSVIVGLITLLGKGKNAANERVLRYVASLAMIITLVAPLVVTLTKYDLSALADDAEQKILGVMKSGEDINGAYADKLRGYGAAALSEYADGEIAARAKLSSGAAASSFTLSQNEHGELVIDAIEVTLHTVGAIAKRDVIEAYLLAVFGSTPKITFYEKLF